MCRCIHLQERQRSVETVLPPERPTGRVHLPVVGWRRLRGAVREKRDEGISIDTNTHTHTHTHTQTHPCTHAHIDTRRTRTHTHTHAHIDTRRTRTHTHTQTQRGHA